MRLCFINKVSTRLSDTGHRHLSILALVVQYGSGNRSNRTNYYANPFNGALDLQNSGRDQRIMKNEPRLEIHFKNLQKQLIFEHGGPSSI